MQEGDLALQNGVPDDGSEWLMQVPHEFGGVVVRGPFKASELLTFAKDGDIPFEALVRQNPNGPWQTVREVPHVAAYLAKCRRKADICVWFLGACVCVYAIARFWFS